MKAQQTYETFIVWSDGSSKYKNFTKKTMETIPEVPDKIKKVFFVQDCVIILSKQGQVYLNGEYPNPFKKEEKKEEANKTVKIQFKRLNQKIFQEDTIVIKKIVFGQNHILFLDSEGFVYTMGSNYYGQLGINDQTIPFLDTPKQIQISKCNFNGKHFEQVFPKVNKIYAYFNTSFAIDENGQIYMWGRCEYIPNHSQNVYTPKAFLQDKKVSELDHSSGRIVLIYSNKNVDAIKTEVSKILSNEEEVKKILVNEKGLLDAKVSNDENEDEGYNISNDIQNNNNKKFFDEFLADFSEFVNILTVSNYKKKKFDERTLLSYNKNEVNEIEEILTKEEECVSSNPESGRFLNITKILDKLIDYDELKKDNSISKYNDIHWSIFYNLASNYQSEFKGELQQLCSNLKDKVNNVKHIQYEDISYEDNIKEQDKSIKYIDTISNLITCISDIYQRAFKNAQLENLIYRMSLHQYFINTKLGLDLQTATFTEQFNTFHHLSKYELILKRSEPFKENLLKLYEEYLNENKLKDLKYKMNNNEVFKDVRTVFGNTSKDLERDYVYLSDSHVNSNIIDISAKIGQQWKKLIENIETESVLKQEFEQWQQDFKYLEELNALQGYIEQFKFELLFKTVQPVNKEIYNAQKQKLKLEKKQLEGATTRLLLLKTNILNEIKNMNAKQNHTQLGGERYDIKGKCNKLNYAKILVLQYLFVLINIAFYKKMIWEIVYRYFKDQQKKVLFENKCSYTNSVNKSMTTNFDSDSDSESLNRTVNH